MAAEVNKNSLFPFRIPNIPKIGDIIGNEKNISPKASACMDPEEDTSDAVAAIATNKEARAVMSATFLAFSFTSTTGSSSGKRKWRLSGARMVL